MLTDCKEGEKDQRNVNAESRVIIVVDDCN